MSVGGMNQTQATQTLNQFTRAVNNAGSDSSRVVMKGNQQMGSVKAFFSDKVDRQATIDKFHQAITAKYGQQIGDMAGARLDNLRSSGKALNAGTIRSVLNEAITTKNELLRLNGPMAESYMTGADFEQQADAGFAETGLPEGQKDTFVSALKASVTNMASNTADKIITPAAIREHVATIVDTCKTNYEALKNDAGLQHYTDISARIPEHNKEDMAILMATSGGHNAESQPGMSLILEKLDTMREAQPNGALRPDTVWNACMGDKEMPPKFGDPLSHMGKQLEDAIFQDLEDKGATVLSAMGLVVGMKYDAAIELEMNNGAVTKDACFSLPTLGNGATNGTVDTAEVQLGVDLKRMGLEDGGAHSNFSFSGAGSTTTIDVNDTSKMQEDDVTAYKSGEKSSITSAIKHEVTQMCGNGKQAVSVMYAMSQSGLALMRNLSSFTGAPKSEHAAMNIDVAKQENGDIRMTFTRPEGHALAGGFQYDVHADGTSTLNELNFYHGTDPKAA
ncbi:MAG: hypothetical protein R3Y11_00025 [Pseudomonadota bacterium]